MFLIDTILTYLTNIKLSQFLELFLLNKYSHYFFFYFISINVYHTQFKKMN